MQVCAYLRRPSLPHPLAFVPSSVVVDDDDDDADDADDVSRSLCLHASDSALQSGASNCSLGFEDEDLGSSPG